MSDMPYPGLRPFKRDESDIFFGREEQTTQLLEKLSSTRFISVVGLSGCGKSSLVRAGMIADLESGFLSTAGAHWRVAEMRPGNDPLGNLAKALLAESVLRQEFLSRILEEETQTDVDKMLPSFLKSLHRVLFTSLRRSPLGLLEVLRETPLPKRTNLLILVDQFEELFRFHRQGNRDKTEAFVALLLASAKQKEVPIYIVTTMRSGFIGDCAMFYDLPEMMNSGQFLVPCLTRKQQEEAIIGPAGVFGGNVEPRLVNQLLNEMGNDPDQLPLLQHCLMCMWYNAKEREGITEEEMETGAFSLSPTVGRIIITPEDYEAVGGLKNVLSGHVDEAFAELNEKQQRIAEYLFRCLSERDPGQRATRRPVSLEEVTKVANAPEAGVKEVVEVFRHADRCFLTPAEDIPLKSDSVLDISHESLIRQWQRMREWVEQEANSAETYRRLEQTACLWKQGKAALWNTPDLENALTWREREKPTEVWASRYGNHFKLAKEFLDVSARAEEEKRLQEERKRQKALRRTRRQLIGAVIGLVVALILAGWALWERSNAEKANDKLIIAKELAEKKGQKAEDAQAEAERYARIFESRHLAARSENMLDNYPQLSLLLAVEALNVTLKTSEERVPAAEEALRQALTKTGGLGLSGHKAAISVVAISPDSRWLVSGSDDNTARLWDLSAPDPAAQSIVLRGHEKGITTVAISSDNRWLVTGSKDGSARLWDLSAPDPAAQSIVLRGHENGITTVAISSDNRWLVTGSKDGSARLWDLSAPDLTATPIVLHGYERAISAVAISADNHWLVTGSNDNTARLWDLTAPDPAATPIVLHGHERGITTVVISADNHWLVTGSKDGTARLWDLSAPDPAAKPSILRGHEKGISAVAISPDNRWLVTGSEDGTARLWDLSAPDPAAQPVVLYGHERGITTVAISSDNHWLVTGSYDSTTRLWDLNASDPAAQSVILRGHESWVTTVAISSDNRWLATGSNDNTARLWELTTPDPAVQPIALRGHEERINTVAISANSRWLVTGSDDETARLWDLNAPDPTVQPVALHGHEERINAVAISGNNRWLVTGSDDRSARLWDLNAPDPAAQPIILLGHEERISAVAISANSHWLVTGSDDGTARLWNLNAPDPAVQPVVLRGHEEKINAVVISGNSRWLVTSSDDGTARLWDLNAPDPAAQPIVFPGYRFVSTVAISPDEYRFVSTVAISMDSRWLVISSGEGIARLWDLWDLNATDPDATSIVLSNHKDWIRTVAISADSHWLVTGSGNGIVRMWDLTAPDPAMQPIVLRGHKRGISTVAISADSRWLVTGSGDGIVRIWDLTASDAAAASVVLRADENSLSTVTISSDNRWLVTGSGEKTARLWTLRLEELIKLACRTAGRNLSGTEWKQYFPEGKDSVSCPDIPSHPSVSKD